MALSQEEIQIIVSKVLSSLQTNSKTISQLTPVQMLSDVDSFEINGGKRVDFGVIKKLIADIFQEGIDSVNTNVNALAKTVANNSTSIKSNTSAIQDNSTAITRITKSLGVPNGIATLNGAGVVPGSQLPSDLTNMVKLIGQPDGTATLDSYGKVPLSQLPEALDDVKEFGGFVENVSYQIASSSYSSTESRCAVVYDTVAKAFRLRVTKSIPILYYFNWADRASYGDMDGFDCKPVAGKIYVNTATNELYRWDGSDLRILGKGEEEQTLKCFADEPDDVTSDLLEELLLVNAGNYDNLYFRFYSGTYKYVQINSDSTGSNETLLARGFVTPGGVCALTPYNDSGVMGYALCRKADFSDYTPFLRIDKNGASDMNNAPGICRILSSGFRFIHSSEVTSKLALNIREINLSGNLINTYLHVYKGSENTYLQLRNTKELWAEGSKLLAVGTIADEKVTMYQQNDSGVTGTILLRDVDMVNTASSSGSMLDAVVCGNIDEAPEIRFLNHWKRTFVVASDGTGDFTSIVRAVLEATKYYDSTIYVKAGTYSINEEFRAYYGLSFFDEFNASSPKGLVLCNRVNIEFAPNANVYFLYSGENPLVCQEFAPFLAGSDGFRISGLRLTATNCRCCVRDTRSGSTDSYQNIYENCTMILDNRTNEHWGSKQCIAGNLGKSGLIKILDCEFESKGIVSGYGIVSYHNCAETDSMSKVVVRGCNFIGLSTFRFSSYGESQKISTAIVSGCTLGAALDNRKEVPTAPYDNTEIVSWGNEVRDIVYLGLEKATDEDIDAMWGRLSTTATAESQYLSEETQITEQANSDDEIINDN